MATPPTFIADNEGASWDTNTSPKTTAAFDSAVGDVWAVLVANEDNGNVVATPTNSGTAQTFTAQGFLEAALYSEIRTWSSVVADALTAQTVSVALTSGTKKYGFNVVRFSGSDGIGATPAGANAATGTPALTFDTTGDNSAIVVIVADWNAADGTTRTWNTVNSITPTAGNGYELTYFRNSLNYTVYVAYYPDAGAAGSKTVGLTAPAGMKWAIAAFEVLGTTAGGGGGFGGHPRIHQVRHQYSFS